MSTPAVPPLDTRPLVEPADPAAARAFARDLRARRGQQSVFSGAGGIAGAVVAGFIGLVALFLFAAIFAAAVESGQPLGYVFAVVPILIPAAFVTLVIVRIRRGNAAQANTWYRLDRFARANGLAFNPSMSAPARPGMIFSLGSARRARDIVSGVRRRPLEVANYSYETGSGKDRTTHYWGYLALRLPTPLPHIVLDATSNNGLFGASNLPVSFAKDQRLSLEGDFDEHFALYCPSGYERDALYLFTPDIMARFIDNAAALDVEVVDDWLFLYAKRDFSTLYPAIWTWLFSIVDALDDKFAQWARWRDERLQIAVPDAVPDAIPAAVTLPAAEAAPVAAPAPALLTPPPAGVAQAGRRLKQGVPWGAIVVGVVFVALWLLFQSGMLEQFLSP